MKNTNIQTYWNDALKFSDDFIHGTPPTLDAVSINNFLFKDLTPTYIVEILFYRLNRLQVKQTFQEWLNTDVPVHVDPKLDFWSYTNNINLLAFCLFILILGLTLPQKPRYIKFLHFIAGIYIIILLSLSSLDILEYSTTFPVPYEYVLNANLKEEFSRMPCLSHNPLAHFEWREVLWDYNRNNFDWNANITSYSNFFFLVASFAVICLLFGVSDKFYSTENNKMEFLLLVIFIYIGSVFLIQSIDFISILILLECVAFSSYILVGFERKNKFSSSSGIKYLILGSIPGGLFVLGITLLYKNYGSFLLNNLENLLITTNNIENTWVSMYDSSLHTKIVKLPLYHQFGQEMNLLSFEQDFWSQITEGFLYNDSIFLSTYVAIILIFINLLFKLTAAPVHMWAPSVYGGSPLSTVTFLSIFSKLTIIFFSIYMVINVFHIFNDITSTLLICCGTLSILCGILGAFSEKLIKRFFVYSSMGHVGFMLLGIAASNIGFRGAIDYLIVYVKGFQEIVRSKELKIIIDMGALHYKTNQNCHSLKVFDLWVFDLFVYAGGNPWQDWWRCTGFKDRKGERIIVKLLVVADGTANQRTRRLVQSDKK